MSNIVAFPSAKSSVWTLLEDDLHASTEPKGLLNVHAEVSTIGRLLPGLACDPLTANANAEMTLASTFTGSAALCTRVFVHDLPSLNELGCTVDGHVLWVPQQFLREQLKKSNEEIVAWMQEGVSACANTALGRPCAPSQWSVVEPHEIRAALQHVSSEVLEHWAPNAAQDRARYQSALNHCGVEQHTVNAQWDSGDANVVWGEIFHTLETTRTHQQWTNQRVSMKGVAQIGAVLAGLANELEGALLKHTIWATLAHVCPAMNDQQLRSIFAAVADHLNSDSDVDTVMGALVDWKLEYDLRPTTMQLGVRHAETCEQIRNRLCYAQWKDHPTPSNQLMALATATRHEEECSEEARKLCARINFTSQDIVDLSNVAPQLLLEALKSSPTPTDDIFNTVANSFLNPQWDHANNCAQFTNTLLALMDKGWAKDAADLDPKHMWEGSDEQINRGLSWVSVVEEFAFEDEAEGGQALAKQWPRLVDAALKINPKFATQALWLFSQENDVPAVVYETLIGKGADLRAPVAFGPTQATLGEAVLRKTDSMPLKTLIRRELAQDKFGASNVVGITRKFE